MNTPVIHGLHLLWSLAALVFAARKWENLWWKAQAAWWFRLQGFVPVPSTPASLASAARSTWISTGRRGSLEGPGSAVAGCRHWVQCSSTPRLPNHGSSNSKWQRSGVKKLQKEPARTIPPKHVNDALETE